MKQHYFDHTCPLQPVAGVLSRQASEIDPAWQIPSMPHDLVRAGSGQLIDEGDNFATEDIEDDDFDSPAPLVWCQC